MMLMVIFIGLFSCATASHFRGAIVQWRPVNNTPMFDGRIEVSHRISWRRGHYNCNIGSNNLIGEGLLMCSIGCSGSFSLYFHCTSFSVNEEWILGSNAVVYSLKNATTYFEASYDSCCWISLINGGETYWSIRVKGSLAPRSDNGRINTPPSTNISLIIPVLQGSTHQISIPYEDVDQDVVRCRWAAENKSECRGMCGPLNGASLDQISCVLTFHAMGVSGWYGVAIQIEDFISQNSTTPMSSIPVQILIHVANITYTPVLVGSTPLDGSCVSLSLGEEYTAEIAAYSGRDGANITSFIISSPVGLTRSDIKPSTINSSIFYINVTWSPNSNQTGTLQMFCYRALNSFGLETNQSCISLAVGGASAPKPLQHSLFPVGTISPTSNTVWQISFNQAVRKPATDKFIRFYEMDSERAVYNLSTRSTSVNFSSNGTKLTFNLNFLFILGRQYYILLDSGLTEASQPCFQESLAVTSSTFWNFLIGNEDFARTYQSCPSSEDKETLKAEIIRSLASRFGVHSLGHLREYPANSCDDIITGNPVSANGVYWILVNGTVEQENCFFLSELMDS